MKYSYAAAFIAALALVSSTASAQAIIGTTDAGNQCVVFPTPDVGLPNPTQNNVPGLPIGARPHGVGYYGSDNALVSDFSNGRVFVIQISTASLVDTIPTSPTYNSTGTIAIAPNLTKALACGGATNVAVISAPFGAGSSVTSLPISGTVAGYQTQAIVYNAAGRAFVHHTTGIAVIDPPYTAVAFEIPTNFNGVSGAIAITPDGNHLLATDLNFNAGVVRIFTAPFSVASVPVNLTIPGGSFLDGIQSTPDGTKVLVVSAATQSLWAISAPYNAASNVQSIPLPGTMGTFEDVGISADSQIAILAGNEFADASVPFIRAPFTTAGATVFDVQVPGGRGAGAVRFLPPGLAPGLTIAKSAPANISTGADMTYDIAYGNTGQVNAANVVIKDTVPAGTTFVSATGGGVFAAGVVTWNIGPLNAGTINQHVTFTVNVTATSGTIDNNNYTIEATNVAPIPGPPVTTNVLGIEGFCFGDGSGSACPCGNNGGPGNGCANSSFAGGANLSTSGNASIANDTLVLIAADVRPSSLQLFLQGSVEITPTPFGDGLRCIDAFIRLFRVKGNTSSSIVSAPSLGSIPPTPATISGESAAHGDPLSAGTVRSYQVYYRDPVVGFCPPGGTSNATNAVRVTWGP